MRSMMLSLSAVVIALALSQGAAYPQDFSADMVVTSPEGTFTSKLYVSGENTRTDMPEASTISRMGQKVVWVLMPREKMYMEHPVDPRTAVSAREKVDGELERTAQGNETVNGRDTTKYLVTYESKGRKESVYQWIDESAHIPVKTAATDGSWSSEFKNIVSGTQDPSLFEIPDGYTKMSMQMPDMSAMMGAMAGETKEEESQ